MVVGSMREGWVDNGRYTKYDGLGVKCPSCGSEDIVVELKYGLFCFHRCNSCSHRVDNCFSDI